MILKSASAFFSDENVFHPLQEMNERALILSDFCPFLHHR